MAEDLSCGFCLQKLTYMIEPKQLPCSHVFCLPCLEEDPKKDCPVCGKLYDTEWTGIRDFQCDSSDGEISVSAGNTDHISCDLCEEQIALCYCVDCEQKLCDDHFKLHEQSKVFFSTKHHQIDISLYNLTPDRYRAKYCPVHEGQKLTSACYNCHNLYCKSCNVVTNVCSDGDTQTFYGKSHDTASVRTMAAHVRHDLHTELKMVSDEVTDGLNREKNTWEGLHEVEADVSKILTQIDQHVEEMVKTVRKSGEALKEELMDYQRRCTEEVEASSKQLRDKRDKLERLWKSVMDELRHTHDTVIIKTRNQNERKIKSALPANYDEPPKLSKIMLAVNSSLSARMKETFGALLSLREPSCIEIEIQGHFKRTFQLCYTVAWHGDEIMCGGISSVWTFDSSGGVTQSEVFNCNSVHCLRTIGPNRFAMLLSKDDNKRELRISSKNSLKDAGSTVYKYHHDGNALAHLSVLGDFVAVCNNSSNVNSVIILNLLDGSEVMRFGSGQELKKTWGVQLQMDSVLVTQRASGSLYKYMLEADSEPVWICRGLSSPTGICVDEQGFIYVASNRACVIYLISPDGICVSRLRCEGLDALKSIHDISLSDDGKTLAIACRDEGVKLISINDQRPANNKPTLVEEE